MANKINRLTVKSDLTYMDAPDGEHGHIFFVVLGKKMILEYGEERTRSQAFKTARGMVALSKRDALVSAKDEVQKDDE